MRNNLYLFSSIILLSQVALSAQDTTIPAVIVSGTSGQHDSLANAPKTIITHQEIAETGVSSLSQALQNLGGIQLQDETGTGSQVGLSLRGFGSNANSNTLLLINGLPITNPDIALPDLNAIPVQEIEYIEITAGSESVLYGDGAVGGTINIVTRQKTDEKAGLSCSLGSYNQRTCSGAFSHYFKKLNYDVLLLNNHTDNYRQHNNYDQTLLSGKADYAYQTGNIGFDYNIVNERLEYPGSLTAEQVAQNRRFAANDTDFFKDWNGFYHLKLQQKITPTLRFETDLFRRETHGSGVLTSPFTQSRIIYYVRPVVKATLGRAMLAVGSDAEEDRYHLASLFGTTQDSQQKYGVFSLLRVPVTPRVSLSVGARGAEQKNNLESFSKITRLNRAIATTLGAKFQYNPMTQFYLRRAESFRFPKADENASTAIGVNGLKTQKGVSYETGVVFEWKKTMSRLSIYQLNLKDEIAFDPTQTPLAPFGVNKNLDPTRRRGFSLSEKYPLTDRISFGGQYNYVNARFDSGVNSGKRIPLVAENNLHAGLDVKITPRWNLYTEAVLTGNQFADSDDANIAPKVAGYTVYNFNLRYSYRQLSASFRVNNVFNKYYYFYTVFVPSAASEFFYPAPGRTILFTLKYTL